MIFDYDNVSVSLKWEKPQNDGGRPITHYTVEMKDKFAVDWVEVTKTTDATPEAKVEGLKEKMVYQFRVRAHNKAGPSQPSEPTDNHLCKHKNRKIFLEDETLWLYLYVRSMCMEDYHIETFTDHLDSPNKISQIFHYGTFFYKRMQEMEFLFLKTIQSRPLFTKEKKELKCGIKNNNIFILLYIYTPTCISLI